MRKVLATIVAVGAIMVPGAVGATVASAEQATDVVISSGVAGPYKTLAECEKARKAYAAKGYQVGPCGKVKPGVFYFKFS